MARLFWQRCPRCGRLTLSRVGSPVSCECAHRDSAPAPRPYPTSTPEASGVTPALPGFTPPPGPAPVLALMTPEQDAVARRLLATVFPNGFDF